MTNKQLTRLCSQFNSEYTPLIKKAKEEGWNDVKVIQEEDLLFDKYTTILSQHYKDVDRAWGKFWTTANQLAK